MKKILVTTDLSDESKEAFETAREYAAAMKASVILLTVVEDPAQAAMSYAMEFPVFPDSEIQQQLIDKVKEELSQLSERFFRNVEYEFFVREARGPIHLEIIEFARQKGADLIVSASHGRSGLRNLLIGSITERIVRESTCPVLIVPIKRRNRKKE